MKCGHPGAYKELKPLSAATWSLPPAIEEEDIKKPTGRKREWRGRGLSGPAAAKRLRTAVGAKSRNYEELEDWEEGACRSLSDLFSQSTLDPSAVDSHA